MEMYRLQSVVEVVMEHQHLDEDDSPVMIDNPYMCNFVKDLVQFVYLQWLLDLYYNVEDLEKD